MTKQILKRLSVPFAVACTVGMIAEIIAVIWKTRDSVSVYRINAWVSANEFLTLTYPIFVTLPFCHILYYENKNGYFNYVQTRVSLKTYLLHHYACGAVMAAACIFLITFSGMLTGFFVKPLYMEEPQLSQYASDFMGLTKIYHPLLYGITLSLWQSVIGTLMYTFGFLLSLNSRHLFVILTGGFIYSFLENFITAVLGCSNFSLCYSFYPDGLNWAYFPVSPYLSLLAGPTVLALVCGGLLRHYITQRRREYGGTAAGAA